MFWESVFGGLIGAAAGALLGTVLGYLASKRLIRDQQRAERRNRASALLLELSNLATEGDTTYDANLAYAFDRLSWGSLWPLISTLEDSDNPLLQALINLDSACQIYDGLAGTFERAQLQPELHDNQRRQMHASVTEQRIKVEALTEHVRGLLRKVK